MGLWFGLVSSAEAAARGKRTRPRLEMRRTLFEMGKQTRGSVGDVRKVEMLTMALGRSGW